MTTETQNDNAVGLEDITIVDNSRLRQAITAAALGNAMEWFDFGVYGFIAIILGKVFFPEATGGLQVIATLATFAVAFFARPIGGLFFGPLGDKYGRNKILSVTIIIMSISTFLIGLIPSYYSIGITAPILLLIARLIQGFSAGGEYCGASIFIAEYAPDRRRGFMGSWLDFGSIAGFLAGAGFVSLLQYMLTETQMLNWGWRVPFLLAGPLGMIGFYLRHHLDETPSFQKHLDSHLENSETAEAQQAPMQPLHTLIANYWRQILKCIGIVIVTNVTYYMLLTYLPSYLTHDLNYDKNHGMLLIIAIMFVMLLLQPLIGLLGDKIGRKPVILTGCIGLFICAIPAFHLIIAGEISKILLGLILLAIFLNMFIGSMSSTLPALFPTNVRYSALALSFNLSISLCGITPALAAWLTETSGNLLMPAYYLMFVAVIGAIAALSMRETANRPLRGELPTASNIEEAKELLVEHHEHIEQRVEELTEEIGELEEKKDKLEQKREQLIEMHPTLSPEDYLDEEDDELDDKDEEKSDQQTESPAEQSEQPAKSE